MKYLIGTIVIGAIILYAAKYSGTKKVSINPQENTIIPQKVAEYRAISQEDAKKRLDSEKDIILLDVRTLDEYVQEHIPNSTLIPLDVLQKEVTTKIPNKEAKIFVYCRSGHRSRIAAETLVSMGYSGVHDMGGIMTWKYETQGGTP